MNIQDMKIKDLIELVSDEKKQFSVKDLTNIVKGASARVQNKSDDVTYLFYSGKVNGEFSGSIAENLAKDNKLFATVKDTPVGQLLESTEFKAALRKAIRLDKEKAGEFVNKNIVQDEFKKLTTNTAFGEKLPYDKNNLSLWDLASKKYTEEITNISGDKATNIRIILGEDVDIKGLKNSVFYQTELPALLQKSGITVDGVKIEDIKKMPNPDSTIIANAIQNSKLANLSYGNTADWVNMTPEKVQSLLNDVNHKNAVQDILKNVEQNFGAYVDTKIAKNLPVASWALLALGLLSTNAQAAEAEARGDTERAKEIWIEFVVGEAGGEIASTAATALTVLAGTALLGLSLPVAAVAGIAVGVVAGIYGEEATQDLYQLSKNFDKNKKINLFDSMAKLMSSDKADVQAIISAIQNNKHKILAGMPIHELVEKSQSDIAYRYALKELNPFVITEIDYSKFNINNVLDLYSIDTPNGMTKTYIQKRAEMLHALINTNNPQAIVYYDLESKQFVGESLSNTVLGSPFPIYSDNAKVVFGTEKDDSEKMRGSSQDDFLFGGAGNETLTGGKGNDYLEGGIGLDKLEGGDGLDTYFADKHDTISDSDGKGEVLLEDVKLVGGVQDLTGKDKDLYFSEDGSISYRWNKDTKELTVNDGLVIKDFDNGELGINLLEAKGQDIAFVVDVSGSMGDDISAVVNQLDKLLNMIFSPQRGMMDTRISVVAYEQPITVLQKFTQHNTVAERKAAAKQAIAKLPNMIAGGTEYLYTALYTVLSGGAGEWRKDAKARHIFLIGDEPGDDAHLAKQVYALAKNLNINANITTRSAGEEKFYDVRFKSLDTDDVVSVNIHPIMIGNNTKLSEIFNDIANQTGGNVHHTNGANDIADVLYDALQSGTADNDVQIGSEANNTFNGRAGDDKLFGYAGNDTLNGGVGNDFLDGGEGADTFIFSRYFGQDVVVSDKLDTFVFNGISLNHLLFVQTDNDLLIQQKGTKNQITVIGFFDGVSSFASLQDDFGNTLSSEQVSQLAQPIPNIDKNQTITGNIFANYLIGGSGNDVLYAKAGADTLRGGLGNDRLEGGLGQDTYLFQAGDGNDTIRDSMGNDTLRFENINLDRLWFSRDGRNLQIEVLDGGGSVTVENYFMNTKSTHFSVNMIEHFQADNHYLSSSKIHQLLDIMGNFSPAKNPDWNVDVQKQQYLQNMQIEQYWHNLEQY